MSLERLTIHLHCWPTRRPPRRAPSRGDRPVEEEAPARRFVLVDVALDGDDVRDVERFDFAVADALLDAAARLARVPMHRLVDLRSLGYATRLEVNAIAAGGTLELDLPAKLVAVCQRLGLSVQFVSDRASIDRDEQAFVSDDVTSYP